MKKILAIGITLLIVACGKNDTENKTTAKESKPSTTTAKTESNTNTTAAKKKKATKKITRKSKRKTRSKKAARRSARKTVSIAHTIRDKTTAGKIIKADPKSDNPLLAMSDRDAFKYLLIGSKGRCDRKLRYSREACEKFIRQVMNKDERWFHIISHYKIRGKHFQDQRVYKRMRYELTRNKSARLKGMRDDYGMNGTGPVTANTSATKTTAGKKNPDQNTPYLH